jgi:hypothetical protein
MWKAIAIDVPHDGTCMFHAIGVPLKINGHSLRDIVCEYITYYSESILHDVPLKDWIEWDTGETIKQYENQLKNGRWGGSIETTILSSLLNIPIFVYEISGNSCRRISESRPDKNIGVTISNNFKKLPSYICLLYTGRNHYMYLKNIKN